MDVDPIASVTIPEAPPEAARSETEPAAAPPPPEPAPVPEDSAQNVDVFA